MAKGKRRKAAIWLGGHAFLIGRDGILKERSVCNLPPPDPPAPTPERCRNCERGLALTW